MRGLPDDAVGTVVEGMAPRLDILLNGSDEVNRNRAEEHPSVATAAPALSPRSPQSRRRRRKTRPAPAPTPGPREIEVLTRSEVAKRMARSPKRPKPADVELSLFVRISQDLDPDVRQRAIAEIGQRTRRARWKLNTAAVEATATQAETLSAIEGVTYVEPGETLHAPEPTVEGSRSPPDYALRRVAEQSRQHRHGRGVLVGIIDVGGFDFAHEDFLDDRGETRWVAIWDQAGTGRPAPAQRREHVRFSGLDYGAEIIKADMDAALAAVRDRRMAATGLEPQSMRMPRSHGTHVASIAAGNRGVARQAYIAGVLIALRPEDLDIASTFYDSTRIADAVDYLLALAAHLADDGDPPLPVSINVSLGTNGHAHDTSSPVARWIDNALSTAGRSVCVAAGNAGQVEPTSPTGPGVVMGRVHAAGRFAATGLRHELGWVVGGHKIDDISENEMEIWYGPQDRFDVEIRPPDGTWIGPIEPGKHIRNEVLENGTVLSIYSETYYPANGANRITIILSPFYGEVRDGVRPIGPIAAGEWRVRLTGSVVRDGRYDAWIERDDPRQVAGTGGRTWRFPSFFAQGSYTADRMISSLACAERLVAVANVDAARNMAHVTSSRGPTREGRFKPDIGADGTDVVAAGGFDNERPWVAMTGTSMASPYVCGVAALMLAIHGGLTAAQINGIMRTTSAPLPGHDFAWRNDTGFGLIDAAACVREAAAYEKAAMHAARKSR